MDTKLTVSLAVIVGAAATWLWTRQEPQPAAAERALTDHGVSQRSPTSNAITAPSIASHAAPESPLSHPAEAANAPEALSGNRDDSTYDSMLASAQTYPDWLPIAGNLTRMHERFVLTPDEPDWARPMERSLRDFFRARTGKPFEFTSIACRSRRCEVQVLIQLDRQVDPASEAARQQQKMLEPVHDTRPLGHSVLRQDAIERVGMGDHVAMLISYEQVEPETADMQSPASSPQ